MAIRVGITGIGMVLPVGNDTRSAWQALQAGNSGVDRITKFDTSQLKVHIGAEVKSFNPLLYMSRYEIRQYEPFVQLAIAASLQALSDAHLKASDMAEDIGVIIGSASGGVDLFDQHFKQALSDTSMSLNPSAIINVFPSTAAGCVSRITGARGPCFAVVSACTSGSDAIGTAYEIIRRGDACAMIAGGTAASNSPIFIAAFYKMGALSTRNENPQRASRPFDGQRDGCVLGEGACTLILEDLELAMRRSATVYAEIVGYAATSDAYHITEPAPGGTGLQRAIQRALVKANLCPEQIDYINAHGTSTIYNDREETKAIKAVFGAHARNIPISSIKSMTGHLMGASGSTEIAITALALYHGIIPPTINYEYPDPDCDLDYVPNIKRHIPISIALSNSMAFNGHNSVVILKRLLGTSSH